MTRTEGAGGEIHSFCAMNSLSMSFWIVPPSLFQAMPRRCGHGEVHRQQDAGAAVDRHRGGDAIERNVGEQRLHVGQGRDGDAFAADLAQGARVVGVVAHERRHVEGRREPGLPLLEQELEALVRVLRRAEAGELAHGPELAAVHARVGAARERVLARMPKLVVVGPAVLVLRRVQRLHFHVRQGRIRGQPIGRLRVDAAQPLFFDLAILSSGSRAARSALLAAVDQTPRYAQPLLRNQHLHLP